MKRTSLTTAVIASIAGVAGISNMASAVYLNTDGLGQVLIYPYYTVNANNSTAISVVNTTNQGKAIKVRFLEAYDSREVLDFNLYMSPQDVWTGQVVPVGAGAGIFSGDNSCTVPALPKTSATAQPFLTYAFDGEQDQGTDGGPTDVSRTLEGYIELIEMGTVTNTNNKSLAALTHGSGGVPANCAQLVGAWATSPPGYWTAGGGTPDLSAPSGGLFGSGTIVNVGLGTVEGYNADAVDSFWLPGSLPTHTDPTSLAPDLSSGGSATSYVFANGALATTSYSRSLDAVSSLFMSDFVYNQYITNSSIGASTEWVVTFPTKNYYVDIFKLSGGTINFSGAALCSLTACPIAADDPFDIVFGTDPVVPGSSCSSVGISFYDREEKTSSAGTGFSPVPNKRGNALCYESQVVTFNQGTKPSKILGSNLVANINTGFQAGWASLQLYNSSLAFAHHELESEGGNTFFGQPVTGFEVDQFINGNLGGGILSNYTAAYRHKFHRLCNTGSTCS